MCSLTQDWQRLSTTPSLWLWLSIFLVLTLCHCFLTTLRWWMEKCKLWFFYFLLSVTNFFKYTVLLNFFGRLNHTSFAQKQFSIRHVGQYLKVSVKLGLVILWNGNGLAEIEIEDQSFHGKMCGLCGNADQDSSNDMVQQDSKIFIVWNKCFLLQNVWGFFCTL